MKLPTVLDLDGPVIIFGGGNVGIRKVEYVSRFTDDIILVSENNLPVPEHVTVNNIKVNAENMRDHIPQNTAIVITALSDKNLNREIASFCTSRKILVNVVDDPEPSTIQFPALSKKGDLNIAISTSGSCPFLARKIREEIDDWILEKAGWLEVLAPIRKELVGKENKDEVLARIYDDAEISLMVKEGELESAKKKAQEVYDVHREH